MSQVKDSQPDQTATLSGTEQWLLEACYSWRPVDQVRRRSSAHSLIYRAWLHSTNPSDAETGKEHSRFKHPAFCWSSLSAGNLQLPLIFQRGWNSNLQLFCIWITIIQDILVYTHWRQETCNTEMTGYSSLTQIMFLLLSTRSDHNSTLVSSLPIMLLTKIKVSRGK